MRKQKLQQYQRLMEQRVRAFGSNCSNCPTDELRSVANHTFMTARQTWDPRRSSFGTYLRVMLDYKLMECLAQHRKHQPGDIVEMECPRPEWNPFKAVHIKEMMEALSEEAKYVVGIILGSPVEVLELLGTETPKAVRGALKLHLRQRGWSWNKVWKSFKEVKTMVRSL